MKLPWTKETARLVAPPPISDEEMLARNDAFKAMQRERAGRAARIPENLVGYRLSRGCTCGAEAKEREMWGDYRPSAGVRHEDDCEAMRGLYMQVIEV